MVTFGKWDIMWATTLKRFRDGTNGMFTVHVWCDVVRHNGGIRLRCNDLVAMTAARLPSVRPLLLALVRHRPPLPAQPLVPEVAGCPVVQRTCSHTHTHAHIRGDTII